MIFTAYEKSSVEMDHEEKGTRYIFVLFRNDYGHLSFNINLQMMLNN